MAKAKTTGKAPAKRPTAPTTKNDNDSAAEATEPKTKSTSPDLSGLIVAPQVVASVTAQVDDCIVTLRPFEDDDAEYFGLEHARDVNAAKGRTLINIGDEDGETDYLLADFESFMLSMYALAQRSGVSIPAVPNS